MRLLVGTYTEAYGPFRAQGQGLTLARFDAATGVAEPLDICKLDNPAYVRPVAPDRAFVCLENADARAAIAEIRIDADRLHVRQMTPVPGRVPCHVDWHPAGFVACACYDSGDVLVGRAAKPGAAIAWTDAVRHDGHGPHPVRQTKAHPHASLFTPRGDALVVPDLGSDTIALYPFDAASGRLGTPRRLAAPAGSGPRTIVFDAPDRCLVVMELASRLALYTCLPNGLVPLASVPTLPDGATVPNTASGLAVHPVSGVVAVTNRGHDSIALIDANTPGTLQRIRVTPCGGTKPRDATFTPDGRWLLVANQDSDGVAIFRVGAAGRRIGAAATTLAVASPSCVRVLPDA